MPSGTHRVVDPGLARSICDQISGLCSEVSHSMSAALLWRARAHTYIHTRARVYTYTMAVVCSAGFAGSNPSPGIFF